MDISKIKLIHYLHQKIDDQKDELIAEKESVNDEIGKETKSSAGDKFETSREMMNQERDRLEGRIVHLEHQLRVLQEMESSARKDKVEFGAFVQTDKVLFLFGLAYGKLSYSKNDIMVLSLTSPIGKAFLNAQTGSVVNFMKQSYTIKSIH